MTVRAIAGIVALNVLLLVIGAALLWALRAWRSWLDLARLAGLAYLLGVGGFCVALTLLLVAGITVGGWTILATGLVLAAAGVATGLLRGFRLPETGGTAGGWRPLRLGLVVALLLAGVVVYLEALFRSARLQPLSEWDAWWVWTLRAKAIFHFGDLGSASFAPHAVGASYPPGLSLLEASAFHAMGSTDVVTLHVQYWFLAVGFVAAVAGLLVPLVRPVILLPVLLLVLVMPSFTERVSDGRADLPLAYLAALGALLIVLWLEERQLWQLASGSLLLSAAMLTKREGLLLAACIFLAAFVASWRERRSAWQWLAGSVVAAVALAVPWRIWFVTQGLPSDVPENGYGVFDELDRVLPSLRLVVRVLFDYDLWLLLPVIAVVAIALAAISPPRRAALFPAVFLGAAVIASSWVIWSNPTYEITEDYGLTPVVRLVGDSVLILAALTPLLLEGAWSSTGTERRARLPWQGFRAGAWVRLAPWAVLAVGALGYPASMLAGTSALRLPGGVPSFPSAAECERPVVEGEEVRVVFGYEASYAEADVLRGRATEVTTGVEVAQDGCGRLRVYRGGLSAAEGSAMLDAARERGLGPTLEDDSGGSPPLRRRTAGS